ncbi:MAG: hypothetical protein J6N81_06240 [Treponema sp.]|nr:hypothetical protein [Treponema sp.]
MVSISDFIKLPKHDSCNHLSSGMRYPSFTHWAGFVIPNFSESSSVIKAGSPNDINMRREISVYTQTRIGISHDIFLLFCHSLAESLSENVISLNGTMNVDFCSKCKNATEFLDIVKEVCEKYSDKVTIRPFLGFDSDNENNIHMADMLLESGLFVGIELYGSGFAEKPKRFLSVFNTARRMNIDSRIVCLGLRNFENREGILEILQNLQPTIILNPNVAISKEKLAVFKNGKILPEVLAFLRDTGIKTEFSPAPFLSGVCAEEKNQAIREFAENDLPFSLCTEDLLFLNKSLSEFATDLCNSGVFSKEEVIKIMQKS